MSHYKILGANNVQKYVSLVQLLGLSPQEVMTDGVDEALLADMDKKAQEVGLSIIAISDEMIEATGKEEVNIHMEESTKEMSIDGVKYPVLNMSGDVKIKSGVLLPFAGIISKKKETQIKKVINSCNTVEDFLENFF